MDSLSSIFRDLGEEWSILVPETISEEELVMLLSEKVNHLIQHDFNRLLSILYRIDINEVRLKELLRANPEQDAGKLIAAMIVQRQKEKAASRKQHSTDLNKAQDDEEKWQ